jgi:hypothetical protein
MLSGSPVKRNVNMTTFRIKRTTPNTEISCGYVEQGDSIVASNRPNPQETIYLYITTSVQMGKSLHISCFDPTIAQFLRTGTILLYLHLCSKPTKAHPYNMLHPASLITHIFRSLLRPSTVCLTRTLIKYNNCQIA